MQPIQGPFLPSFHCFHSSVEFTEQKEAIKERFLYCKYLKSVSRATKAPLSWQFIHSFWSIWQFGINFNLAAQFVMLLKYSILMGNVFARENSSQEAHCLCKNFCQILSLIRSREREAAFGIAKTLYACRFISSTIVPIFCIYNGAALNTFKLITV